MKITQVSGGIINRKIHLKHNVTKLYPITSQYLCGLQLGYFDIEQIDKMDFSKGLCKVCNLVYENKYKKSFIFLIIKLKLGIKNA